MKSFTEKVIQVIQKIPKGKVLTYGAVARSAGNAKAARQVARILHSMSTKHNLPWHRVVNGRGQISLEGRGGDLQKSLLESEGVVFTGNGIDLKVFLLNQPGT
ncbi:MAG: methylated-DNA--[protein]-cysteine S-methyltransferase [Spirochaetales bacterium]|nr:methylated-DNA--[protein]-cysteine S-methyltransferase [Spirochaetales bacterium]